MTTPLFVLRCLQLGLTLSDLDQLDYSFVLDMMTESDNDSYNYPRRAMQADFDRLKRG